MKEFISGAFAAAALLSTPFAVAEFDAGKHALIGEWEFDASQSMFDGALPYNEALISFRPIGDCIEVKQRILEGNAINLTFSYCDRQDGQRVPVVGNPFYDSESTVWIDERTAIRTEYRGATTTGSTTMVVSPDGTTYTAAASRTLPNGRLYVSEIVWKRVK